MDFNNFVSYLLQVAEGCGVYESCEHVPLRVMMVFHSGDPCGHCTYLFSTKVFFFCFLPIAVGRDK